MKIEATVSGLDDFLKGRGPFAGLGLCTLAASYDWPLPKSTFDLVGDLGGGSRLDQTRQLKRKLSKMWQQEPDRQLELASWIVADWGGVRGNRPARLQQHLVTAQMDDPATPFLGLSSYSKILAVRDPDRFAILDARVVVAMNALQILAGNKAGLAFPYIQGRNLVTGNQLKKQGFACQAEFSVQSLVEGRGWQRVPRDEMYETYLRILQGWLLVNPSEAELMLVEMALFSQAEELAKQAFQSLRKVSV